MMIRYKYTDSTGRFVSLIEEDGKSRFTLGIAAIPVGIVPESANPLDPALVAEEAAMAKTVADSATAKAHVKLKALAAMSPAQVQTWVAANVKTIAQAQDAIATLAIAVSILARRL